jgi:hypothetical protein
MSAGGAVFSALAFIAARVGAFREDGVADAFFFPAAEVFPAASFFIVEVPLAASVAAGTVFLAGAGFAARVGAFAFAGFFEAVFLAPVFLGIPFGADASGVDCG